MGWIWTITQINLSCSPMIILNYFVQCIYVFSHTDVINNAISCHFEETKTRLFCWAVQTFWKTAPSLRYCRAVHLGTSRWCPLCCCRMLCTRWGRFIPLKLTEFNSYCTPVSPYNMVSLCFVRGSLTSLGVKAGKLSGLSVTLLWGAAAPARIRVQRYTQESGKNGHGQFVCYHLPHRTLLKIQGADTSPFLQGIITNDMRLLEEPGCAAMYSHMLNVQGRTLYDILLYRWESIALLIFHFFSPITRKIVYPCRLFLKWHRVWKAV